VVTIGTFDGVHCGRRALVGAARELAAARGVGLIALTFSPRPERLFRAAQALPIYARSARG
jgi:riboflavin kinase / FMN adenylyltransferase